jgi:glycosyltransferase involved in cell wall biosynthesis
VDTILQPFRSAASGLFRRARRYTREHRIAARLRPLVASERRLLGEARQLHDHAYGAQDTPLVSVVIATYNRSELLVERAVASALQQSYRNLEIVVVGDCCSDDTEDRLRALDEPRLRFLNLPARPVYPENRRHRWMVGGSVAKTTAMRLARGAWIAHLDDDDVFTPDHVEVLLRHAQRCRLELVYGVCRRERRPGEWIDRGDADFGPGVCLPSACLERSYLRVFPWADDAFRTGLPHDIHRWRRMRLAGVRTGFIDRIVTHSPLRPGTTILGDQAEDLP